MTDTAAEKKYDPSSKRLEELKRKGQVLRSRDLSGGILIMVSVTTLSSLSSFYQTQFKHNFIESFSEISTILRQQDYFLSLIKKLVINNCILLIPILIVVLISVFLSATLFGGWNFSLQPLAFNLEKLNPTANISSIFSARTLVEIIKSFAKFFLIFLFAFYFFYSHFNELTTLANLQIKPAILTSYALLFRFSWSLLISLIFIVGADMVHQYVQFINKNKMSLQELKDEQKDTDGNLESKRRQKSVQFALLKQRLSIVVPKATVIVTNPSHYAIALCYRDGKDKAPKIIAKGKDYLALQIRTIAANHGIPICPAPPLARAIYHTAKIGTEIHPELYMAVAVVLSYVHQLKNYQQGKTAFPQLTEELSIPERFIFND
jgi:flagellar biosynthetic protein FlhB